MAERILLIEDEDKLARMDTSELLQETPFAAALTQIDIDWLSMKTQLEQWARNQSGVFVEQVMGAAGSVVSSTISAGVSGRVKYVYAQKGDDVTACMAENGALALLSLDGYMAVDIETEALTQGDSVTVTLSDGTEKAGSVETVSGGVATVLVSDDGPKYDEAVTVSLEDGTVLGSGNLYIHSPLRVTGYAGTVSSVNAVENRKVYSTTSLFTLKDTNYAANYESLLRQRADQEEILYDLLTIYQDGAVLAPYDGLVCSVEYDEETVDTTTETTILTLTPNEKAQVTITVGESNILSLEVGQEANVTVSSVSGQVLTGTVTEVSKTAVTSSDVTLYSALVEFPKVEGMLPGMTADVDVQIEGVENAILVPVDAVHQTSAVSYVYTSYDAEAQQFGGMVEVTTGLWGDDFVEITSGLNAGDTVYYTEKEQFSFGFGNFSGMGGMSGGNMDFGGMSGNGGGSGGGRPENMGQMPDFGGSR